MAAAYTSFEPGRVVSASSDCCVGGAWLYCGQQLPTVNHNFFRRTHSRVNEKQLTERLEFCQLLAVAQPLRMSRGLQKAVTDLVLSIKNKQPIILVVCDGLDSCVGSYCEIVQVSCQFLPCSVYRLWLERDGTFHFM